MLIPVIIAGGGAGCAILALLYVLFLNRPQTAKKIFILMVLAVLVFSTPSILLIPVIGFAGILGAVLLGKWISRHYFGTDDIVLWKDNIPRNRSTHRKD